MNDPNGPMRYKGVYHMFYQHNPKGATWGNIAWGHSVSHDLVNWVPLPLALSPTKSYDINGCWSGSATLLHGHKPVLLYTGLGPNQNQTQNLALPLNLSDPFLKHWVRSQLNPLIAPTSGNHINATSFRDPTTAWLGHDGLWRILVGSQRKDRGLALLFKSKDFVQWVKAKHPLYSAKHTGMWECPDFFPVFINSTSGVETSTPHDNHFRLKHVLKLSLIDLSQDYYMIGTYNQTRDSFIPDMGFEDTELSSIFRYDYGKFYASKTFYDDEKKRRILWGWVNESSVREEDVQKGWSGIQGIPRSVWLEESGKQLVQWPIEEIEKLRSRKPLIWHSKVLQPGALLHLPGITAAQADVEVSFEVKELAKKAKEWKQSGGKMREPQKMCGEKRGIGPFGLLVLASKGLQEHTSVFFRIFKLNNDDNNNATKFVVVMCSDQSRSSLNHKNDLSSYAAFLDVDPLHHKLSLRTLIDHSVVESFGGKGQVCITARVYPTLAINDEAQLFVFNNASSNLKLTTLTAWSMKKARVNSVKI
ncbi:beta-fructofuranosidase, insoluble isoenzyme CWINV3-like [Neltuma alba]|uniref:beta-fructofuranosidase, insoluble isoenzyme CWINV3-like n=1 Tax=Neltuma alba TaxID=207710 RepID=UPI0010A311D5|nr:beta-fructofuranosidase, insoluble isoenzyme CWINV3-like [Prosopis alba]